MNLLQIQASDPKFSTWVSASAGTGKTKILTDRVLRLLLQNAEFNKILCLTFTNAAAGEMKERIASALSDWANTEPSSLEKKLFLTLGRNCTKNELEQAQSLYNKYLNSDEKINVQTIHSFCQKLLKKFPLEAGVSPSFTIIDEIKSYQILKKTKNELLSRDALLPINDYLNANFHEVTIDEIISEIIQNKNKFINTSYEHEYIKYKAQEIIESLNNICFLDWKKIGSNKLVQEFVESNQEPEKIKKFFLTDSGQKRQKIVPQKIAKPGSKLYSELEIIQEQVFMLDQKEKTKQLELHSKLLSMLGSAILTEYEEYKEKKGLLDYDDLIIYACRLLQASDAKEWVLYKLDGGIDHLLVDEAQDTSFIQWQIIEALIAEFYSGDSQKSKHERTIFIVGDEKQSIFSFQGADVNSFTKMNSFLKDRMRYANKKFRDLQLETSYRSAKEILDGVHIVFDNICQKMPGLFKTNIKKLSAHRNTHSGSIEIWPLCTSTENTTDFWPVATNEETKTSQTILAEKVSSFIQKQIASKRVLPATGKEIAADDFMILFRTRDELTNDVIHALKKDNIEVTGLDRISLCDNLAVMDLISVAKFALNPYDDLNLCSLLKSPIFGLLEQDLYKIKINQKENFVWKLIQSNDKYGSLYKKLQDFIELYKASHVGNFFQYIVDILGYRTALNSHCGSDSDDAIDELLYACHNFQKQNNNSVQHFIFWLEEYNTSIKRSNSDTGKVKIMTLHASKGLQSPFVILCDTTSIPTQTSRFQWNDDNILLSVKNSSLTPEFYKDIKKQEQDKAYAEYLRLLYVGMTRAEDHLIICGYQGKRALPENCWYELIRSSLSKKSIINDDGSLIFGNPYQNVPPSRIPKKNESTEIEFFSSKLVSEAARIEQKPTFSYNHPSPLAKKDPMNYGLIFHKIIEDSLAVPDLNIMKTHPLIQTLNAESRKRILNSIEKIANNQKFCDLVKKDFHTEISIGTKEEELTKVGRIDLIVIKKSEIIIIDYKSDINPPNNTKKIPKSYKSQLNFYKNIVQKLYPGKDIITLILWLENGNLMEIPE